MSDTVNEYAGLDSRNLEEMVFEEVNPFEDTSKPIIYRQKKPALEKKHCGSECRIHQLGGATNPSKEGSRAKRIGKEAITHIIYSSHPSYAKPMQNIFYELKFG